MLKSVGEWINGQKDKYNIIEELGKGGFGVIYRAKTTDGKFRVVKQMMNFQNKDPREYENEKKYFKREAELLCDMDYPKIVKGYELIEEEDELFLIMEHIDGKDLAKVFEEHKTKTNNQPFDEATVTEIGIEICDALYYFHCRRGQPIYRDMKPANVMWDSVNKTIKIIDFGTARFTDKTKKVTMGILTDGYAAPEMYDTQNPLDFKTDIFTIGATLYELLTGDPPVNYTIVKPTDYKQPANFKGYDFKISGEMKQIVLRALNQEPQKRYYSALEMKIALEKTGKSGKLQIDIKPVNLHPLLSCLCPQCATLPKSEHAIYCGKCGNILHTAVLQVVAADKSVPPTELYLEQQKALIGRFDPDNQIWPDIDLSKFDDGKHVSRKHAYIEKKGTKFYLHTLQTTNPTRLNGILCAPDKTYEIENGSRLQFADLVANLVIKPVIEKK